MRWLFNSNPRPKEHRPPKELVNAAVGSKYLEVWHTARSISVSKFLYTYGDASGCPSYSPTPQNCCEQNCNTDGRALKYDFLKNNKN